MTSRTWYVDVDFSLSRTLNDDDAFDALEALAENAAALSLHTDRKAGSLSAALEAVNINDAIAQAEKLLTKVTPLLGDAEITQIDAMNESSRKEKNDSLSIPELVGYAEIAALANVSRQRARDIAQRDDFPAAVVETAAGPLRVKAAVEQWISNWDRSPGRRKKVALA